MYLISIKLIIITINLINSIVFINSYPLCNNKQLFDTQIYALMDIYKSSFNPQSWYVPWNYSKLCNDNNYVPSQIVSKNGMILTIDLSYNNINGTIPNSVGLLTQLRVFEINQNYISGIFFLCMYVCICVILFCTPDICFFVALFFGTSLCLDISNMRLKKGCEKLKKCDKKKINDNRQMVEKSNKTKRDIA